ncbi:MAG: type II toxin-antitoxin system Phd/YefM family antitoxin [Acidimicrobiales bacterium]
MEIIGVREARQNLSRYLLRTSKGESFTITDHGRPVGQLAPPPSDPWVHIPPPKRIRTGVPKPLPAGAGPTLTEVLLRMREYER